MIERLPETLAEYVARCGVEIDLISDEKTTLVNVWRVVDGAHQGTIYALAGVETDPLAAFRRLILDCRTYACDNTQQFEKFTGNPSEAGYRLDYDAAMALWRPMERLYNDLSRRVLKGCLSLALDIVRRGK